MSVLRRISADVECALFWKYGEADLVWLLMGFCQAKNERPGVWPYGKWIHPTDLLSVGQIKSSFISELVTCQTNCFMVWWQPTIHKSFVYSFLMNLKMFCSLKRSFAIPSPTNLSKFLTLSVPSQTSGNVTNEPVDVIVRNWSISNQR